MGSFGKQQAESELLRVSILRAIDGNIPDDIIAVYERNSSILNQILRIDDNLFIPTFLNELSKGSVDAVRTLFASKSEYIPRCMRSSTTARTEDLISLPLNYFQEAGLIHEISGLVSRKYTKSYSVDGQNIIAEYKLGNVILTYRPKIDPYRLTPLLYAIHRGKTDAVKMLLECGADVNHGCNTSDTYAQTKDITFTLPLHYCIEVGASDEIIYLVLSKHPKLNSVDGQSRTALSLAISEDKYHIVNKLITLSNLFSTEEWIYRHLLAHCAEENGYKRLSQLLKDEIEHNVDDLFQDIQQHVRIEQNVEDNFNSGAKIMKQSKKCLKGKPKTGLLYSAARNGHRNVISFLIQCGSNLNEADVEGQTALHYAAATGNFECAKYLLDCGCDVGLITFQGYSALHLAANFGYLDCVRSLVEKGVDINDTIKMLRDTDSQRSHHYGWFLAEPLCNLEDNTDGITSLTLAVKNQHIEVTEYLLSVKAKLNELEELHESMENSNFKLANIIVEHVDKSLLAKNAIFENKDLDYILAKWCKKKFEVQEADKLVKTYIKNGYQINQLRSFPFHEAVKKANVALAEVFRNNGVDCNRFDFDGNLPIHIAAGVGDVEVMKMLISNRADPMALNRIGLSTVHIAVAGKRLEMVQFLVSLHVDVNLRLEYKLKLRFLVEALFSEMSFLLYNHSGIDVDRTEAIGKAMRIHKKCGISALGIAAQKQYGNIANFLLHNGAVPNGVAEVHICLARRNVKLALLILQFLPENYSLKNDEIEGVPTLHFISTWNIMFNKDMETLICEYIRRGYDINENQFRESQMPLLLKSISTGIKDGNLQMFDFLMSSKDCNIDVLYQGRPALAILLSRDIELYPMNYSWDPTDNNDRNNPCLRYYIKQLITQFASTELCDLSKFSHHFGDADILKLLYAAGLKFPNNFRKSVRIAPCNYRLGVRNMLGAEFLSFSNWLVSEKLKLQSLQYLSRIAFRKLHCARELIRSAPLPEKIKAYLRLDDHPILLY